MQEGPQTEEFPSGRSSCLSNRDVFSVTGASAPSCSVQSREAFMKTAGGVVAILAGISGTIYMGHDTAGLLRSEEFMELSYAKAVLARRLGSLAFFVAIAALGIVAIKANGKFVVIPLVLCAIAGSLLDVTLAMVFAVQAVVGALLVYFDRETQHGA